MGKPTRIVETIETEDGVFREDHPAPAAKSGSEQAEDGWFDFLTEDREAEILVYQQDGSGKDPFTYLFRAPMDKYSPAELMDYLRDEYGSGDYRIRPYKNGRLLPGSRLLTVKQRKSTNALMPVGSGDSVVNALLSEIKAMRQEMLNAKADVKSPVDQIKEMAVMVTALKEVFGIQSAPMAPPSPMNQLKEMIQTMQVMEEVKAMLGGGAEKDDNGLVGVLKEAAPQLLGIVSNLTHPANRAAAPRRRVPPKPQVKPQPTVETPQEPVDITPPKQENEDVNAMITQALPELLQAAKSKSDPEQKVLAILDLVPSMFHARLATEILKPDIVDKIIAIEPRFSEHRKWVEDVIEYGKGHLGYPCKYDAEFEDDDDGITNFKDDDVDIEDDLTDTQETGQTDENSSESAPNVD